MTRIRSVLWIGSHDREVTRRLSELPHVDLSFASDGSSLRGLLRGGGAWDFVVLARDAQCALFPGGPIPPDPQEVTTEDLREARKRRAAGEL
jgi:hypothetical protein